MRTCLTVALVFSLVLAACDRRPTTTDAPVDHNRMDHSKMDQSKMGHSMESSADAASAPEALQFLDTMIVHHQGAIDMALLAETRSGHAELKALAKNISGSSAKKSSR